MRVCDSCDFAVKLEGDSEGLLECRRHAISAVGIDDDGDVVSAFRFQGADNLGYGKL